MLLQEFFWKRNRLDKESGFDLLKIDIDLKQIFAIDEIKTGFHVISKKKIKGQTQNKNVFGWLQKFKRNRLTKLNQCSSFQKNRHGFETNIRNRSNKQEVTYVFLK